MIGAVQYHTFGTGFSLQHDSLEVHPNCVFNTPVLFLFFFLSD